MSAIGTSNVPFCARLFGTGQDCAVTGSLLYLRSHGVSCGRNLVGLTPWGSLEAVVSCIILLLKTAWGSLCGDLLGLPMQGPHEAPSVGTSRGSLQTI